MWGYLQSYPQKNFFYNKLNIITNNSSCRRRRYVNFFFVSLLTIDSIVM